MRPNDKLTRVVLSGTNYDPASRSGAALRARDEFDAADGYELELDEMFVLVTKNGCTAGYPVSAVKYVLIERGAPEPVAQAANTGQWKGKRR